jgi:hypothetical protein
MASHRGWHAGNSGRRAGGIRGDAPPNPERPPSMTICVPVMSLARSEQRYITTFATSSGVAYRPVGVFALGNLPRRASGIGLAVPRQMGCRFETASCRLFVGSQREITLSGSGTEDSNPSPSRDAGASARRHRRRSASVSSESLGEFAGHRAGRPDTGAARRTSRGGVEDLPTSPSLAIGTR